MHLCRRRQEPSRYGFSGVVLSHFSGARDRTSLVTIRATDRARTASRRATLAKAVILIDGSELSQNPLTKVKIAALLRPSPTSSVQPFESKVALDSRTAMLGGDPRKAIARGFWAFLRSSLVPSKLISRRRSAMGCRKSAPLTLTGSPGNWTEPISEAG